MRIHKLVLTVLLTQSIMIAQEPASSSLEGVVLQAGTMAPLAGANVELRTESGNAIVVVADENGRFVLPEVLPGRYRLLARHTGFARVEYGQRSDNKAAFGIPINMTLPGPIQSWRQSRPSPAGLTVGAGQRVTGLSLVMTPGGVISGKVISRGAPLSFVFVNAAKVDYDAAGRPVLTKFLSGVTNDLGEYRIFWLPPGRYYVAAELHDVAPIPVPSLFLEPTNGMENPLILRGAGQAELSRTFLPGESARTLFLRSGVSDSEMRVYKYFPGKSNWREALTVEINAGTEAGNIDIQADSVPALRIRGTVSGVPLNAQNQPIPTQIALSAEDSVFGPFATTQPDSNGAFELSRIPPGSYVLRATAGSLTTRRAVVVRD